MFLKLSIQNTSTENAVNTNVQVQYSFGKTAPTNTQNWHKKPYMALL